MIDRYASHHGTVFAAERTKHGRSIQIIEHYDLLAWMQCSERQWLSLIEELKLVPITGYHS